MFRFVEFPHEHQGDGHQPSDLPICGIGFKRLFVILHRELVALVEIVCPAKPAVEKSDFRIRSGLQRQQPVDARLPMSYLFSGIRNHPLSDIDQIG